MQKKFSTLLLSFLLLFFMLPKSEKIVAQENHKADSLKLIIKNSRDLIKKSNALLDLAMLVRDFNLDSALSLGFEALKTAESENYQMGIARSYHLIATAFGMKGDFTNSIRFLYMTLSICDQMEKDKLDSLHLKIQAQRSKSLGNLGMVYGELKNYEKALLYHLKALRIDQELENRIGIARHLANIGNSYKALGNYKLALIYEQKAYDAYNELHDEKGKAFTTGNIGSIYLTNKEYVKAQKYLSVALPLAIRVKDMYEAMEVNENLSMAYQQTGDYKNALEFYKKAMEIKLAFTNESKEKEILVNTVKLEYEKKEAVAKEEIERQKFVRNSLIGGFFLVLFFALAIYRSLLQNKRARAIITQQKLVVDDKNKEILDSIEYAKRLQNAILPTNKLVKEYLLDSFIYYRPKDIVAGDFYWFHPTKNQRNESVIYFAAADCTGHGVPGAMVSVVCANALNQSVKELNLTETGKILDASSTFVEDTFIHQDSTHEDDVQDGMDISLCCLNLHTLTLQWSGANIPLLIVRSTEVTNNSATVVTPDLIEVKPNKQPIGLYSNRLPFTTHNLQLIKGDMLYLTSDGYADQFGGGDGRKMLKKNLKHHLISMAALPLDVQLTEIAFHFESWKGNFAQVDDVCLIGVRV